MGMVFSFLLVHQVGGRRSDCALAMVSSRLLDSLEISSDFSWGSYCVLAMSCSCSTWRVSISALSSTISWPLSAVWASISALCSSVRDSIVDVRWVIWLLSSDIAGAADIGDIVGSGGWSRFSLS